MLKWCADQLIDSHKMCHFFLQEFHNKNIEHFVQHFSIARKEFQCCAQGIKLFLLFIHLLPCAGVAALLVLVQ
jgi:hypothetical protein